MINHIQFHYSLSENLFGIAWKLLLSTYEGTNTLFVCFLLKKHNNPVVLANVHSVLSRHFKEIQCWHLLKISNIFKYLKEF